MNIINATFCSCDTFFLLLSYRLTRPSLKYVTLPKYTCAKLLPSYNFPIKWEHLSVERWNYTSMNGPANSDITPRNKRRLSENRGVEVSL